MFISHANPEDNVFAQWLALKLAGLGYCAWSDVTRLLGGEDFWRDIESAIRQHAIKVLYVLSHSSNQREGTLQELKVAHDVRKTQPLSDFIIPLRLDDLPFSEFNIQLSNLNAIDFSRGWAPGLKRLITKLEKDEVPKDPSFGPDAVRQWWENAYNAEEGITSIEEVHLSNWFSVQLPPTVYTHAVIGLMEVEELTFPFPTRFRNGIVTFAPAADVEPYLGKLRIQSTVGVPTREFLSDDEWAIRRGNRDMVTYLVNEAWKVGVAKKLDAYAMSRGRSAFYFDVNKLPNPMVKFVGLAQKVSRRGLMGFKTTAHGKRHWHFAVSAKAALHPEPVLMLRSHVLFSDDGANIWESAAQMHRARRSQCKNWWNDDWRDRLLATMAWLADGRLTFSLPLGSSVQGSVSTRPLEFVSPVTLNEHARDDPKQDSGTEDKDDAEPEEEF